MFGFRKSRKSHRNSSEFRPTLEGLEARVTPSLTAVTGAQQPYSAVVSIEVTFPNGQSYLGSGAMIDANSVLTAAHILYSQVDGGWASHLTVWAGYDNGAYVAKTIATQFAVDPRYIAHEQQFDQNGKNYSEDGDIGVVTLKDAIGWTTGVFNVERADSLFNFNGATRSSAGYPAQSPYDGNVQYVTSGPIAGYDSAGSTKLITWSNRQNASSLTLQYGGQSGSPIYRAVNGQWMIDAVFVSATAAPGSVGYGVLLTDPVYDELITWRTQDDSGATWSDSDQFALPNPRNGVASAITHSDEAYSLFVTSAYQTYLGRTPEASETTYWVNQMKSGVSDERIEANFIGSPEYIAAHGGAGDGWIQGMYQDLLGRPADSGGLAYWDNQLAAGESPADIAYGFAASPEREGIRVSADYTTYLGRSPNSNEVNYWVGQFLAGAKNEDVSAGFLGSMEYYQDHGSDDTQWVQAVYHDVLGRAANAGETAYWVRVLNS